MNCLSVAAMVVARCAACRRLVWRCAKKMGANVAVAAVLVSAVVVPVSVRAENWPQWRGPRGDGTSLESDVPLHWNADEGDEGIAWKTELPGKGHASPIVWENHIFTATAIEEEESRVLLAVDRRTGKLLWQRTVLVAPLEGKHPLNSYASGTPATDGRAVYAAFLDRDQMLVVAVDFNGRILWRTRPGPFSSKHGFCSCPVLYDDLVIVNGDHDGDAYLVALHRSDGTIAWKTPRENRTRSYSTPLIRSIGGREQLILSGNRCVASYDPRTGRQLWIIDGPTEQFVASVVLGRELLFMTAGYPERHILAIRPDGHGNVTDSHIVWRTRRGAAYVPSPIAIDGYFLLVSDDGVGSCFEESSGQRLWMKRLGTHFSASPVAAAGLVYFTSDRGETTVLRPRKKLDVVAVNSLGEHVYASPAVSQGNLYFRGERHLFCIGASPK